MHYADFAYGRPGGAALKASGFDGVIRYLSRDVKKRLTIEEITDYQANELKVHAVFEDRAKNAALGSSQGISDALAALAQAVMLGFEAEDGWGVYFAVDFDVRDSETMKQVVSYFRGINTVLRAKNVGVYGGKNVLDTVFDEGLVTYRWQAAAMSWSGWQEAKCDIRQYATPVIVNGVEVDINSVHSYNTGDWWPTVMDEFTVRRIIREELANVWTVHPAEDVKPAFRRLSDYGHTLAQGIPDQVGLVGVAVSNLTTLMNVLMSMVEEIKSRLDA